MIPAVRQRVRVEGRDGLFLVVWVDAEQRIAELTPLAAENVLETVPFAKIRAAHADGADGGGAAVVR